MTTVGEVMTQQPHCIAADTSIAEAYRLMADKKCHHLPVLEDGRLVGLVSERDLLRLKWSANVFKIDMEHDPVGVVMSVSLFCVPPETPLPLVAGQMRDRRIGSAVVVSEGRVVGIFTTSDALAVLAAPSRS